MNAISAILITYASRLDINGNTYHAFRYIDCATGRPVEALVDHESNTLAGVNSLPHGPCGYFWQQEKMSKRDFKARFGKHKYAGCKPSEVRDFILRGIAPEPRTQVEFNEADCGGVFNGNQVISDADPGL